MAGRTKWEIKREASRRALVDAAMRTFHERGYAATTVADIVAGTDYTSGAFYFHFKDKAECFWAVIEQREALRGAWWDAVPEAMDPAEDSLEELLEAVLSYFSEGTSGIGDWVLAMVGFYNQHRDDPDTAQRLAEVYGRWHTELAQFVARLAADGWIAGDRDPATVASEVFAFREGLTTHSRLYGLGPETVRAALIDGLARLLR
jgi:AcrR family transcriptional regulator